MEGVRADNDVADQGLMTISDLPSRGTFGHSGCMDWGWGETEAEGTLDECVASKIKDPGSLFSLKCFVLSYGAIGSSVELSWILVLILASKSRYRKLLKKGWKVIWWLKSEHKAQSEWVIEARDTKPVNNINLMKRAICLQYPLPLSFLMWRLNKALVRKLKRICYTATLKHYPATFMKRCHSLIPARLRRAIQDGVMKKKKKRWGNGGEPAFTPCSGQKKHQDQCLEPHWIYLVDLSICSWEGWAEIDIWMKGCFLGTSLVAQWLRLHAPNAGGPGLIPGQGTRSHMHATTK